MPTPTNFWPPYMGTEFIPEHEKAEKHNLINPGNYEHVLAENPELYVHPLHMTPERCNNLHFRLDDSNSPGSGKLMESGRTPTA